MYNKLMVPLDGFVTAEDALPIAARIAQKTKAKLHIAHVVDLMTRPPYGEAVASHDWWSGGANKYAEEYLRTIIDQLTTDFDVEASHTLLDPPMAESIMREAARVKADLLVLTTHGRTTLGRFWMGSVADQIARQYEGPMLLLRSNEKSGLYPPVHPLKKILVPLDGSRLAEQILPHAQRLAAVDKGALTLFHVAKPYWTPVPVLPFVYAADVSPEAFVESDFEAAGREYLNDLAGNGVDSEISLTDVHVTAAPTALAILDFAKQAKVDAIALTTHGHGGVRRLLLGSVADKVVRGAEVPVLLFRPSPDSAAV